MSSGSAEFLLKEKMGPTENRSKLSSEQLVGAYQRELLMLQTCGGLHHDLRPVLPELNGREHDGEKNSRTSWLMR